MNTTNVVAHGVVLAIIVVVLTYAGWILALIMAYQLWGLKGMLFTLGLLLAK